eukprot:TRINITY_DN2160_c0_g1_i1.p1 TRINITY_DN2160_c0_g1~~TRINITY_DN2160_c0_g1_i1.p1  ORF type:complete len:563 (+),score=149.53 TRINITY_DN2160_c0_g1_i1:160-1848(+)
MALPQAKKYLELFTGLGGGQGFTAAVTPNVLGKREYNREVRGTVLTLDGDDTRLSLPAQCMTSLNLQHKYIGLHLFASSGIASLEVNLVEEKGRHAIKRKICLSSRRQHPSVVGDVANIPLKLPTQTWMFLCVNLPQLVSHCFGGVFSHLESISLGSWCSVRRILALREPVSTSYYPGNGCIPKQYDLPASARCPLISVPFIMSVGGDGTLNSLSLSNARADGGPPDQPVSPIQGIVVNGVGAVGRREARPQDREGQRAGAQVLRPAGALADQSPPRAACGDFAGMIRSVNADPHYCPDKAKGKVQKGGVMCAKPALSQPPSPALDALDDFLLDCCAGAGSRGKPGEGGLPLSLSPPAGAAAPGDLPAMQNLQEHSRARLLNGRLKPSSAPPTSHPARGDGSFQYPHHPDDPDLRRPMSAYGYPTHKPVPYHHQRPRAEPRERDGRGDGDAKESRARNNQPPDYFEACPFGSWDGPGASPTVAVKARKRKLGKSIEEWVTAKADYCPDITAAWGEPKMVGYMCDGGGGADDCGEWEDEGPEPGTEPPSSSLSGRFSEQTMAE